MDLTGTPKLDVQAMNVELLYFDGCPSWRTAADRLAALQAELGFELKHRLVTTSAEAELLGFTGSPMIKVDGVDPFATSRERVGFACRLYATNISCANSAPCSSAASSSSLQPPPASSRPTFG